MKARKPGSLVSDNESGVDCRHKEGALTRRVLVVDDDEGIRRVLARELRRGYDVCLADGASAASALLEDDRSFCAVVSDLIMGSGPTGIEILGEVRLHTPHAVRILISGTPRDVEATRVIQSGIAHEFIEKPWRAGEVLAALDRWVARIASGTNDGAGVRL